MNKLTIEDVYRLLDTRELPGNTEELELLVKWTERRLNEYGEDWIRKNRGMLIMSWKQVVEEFL